MTNYKREIKNELYLLINSIFAGIMVAIGAMVYLKCDFKPIGALLFSIGLLSIFIFKLDLFTGKIGYARSYKHLYKCLIVLIGNTIGSLIIKPMGINSSEIISMKLAQNLNETFFKAILCGILIYVAVESFKRGHIWITLIAVPVFILIGAEHCIADICFAFACSNIPTNFFPFIITTIIGNSIGSLIISMWLDYRDNLLL